MTFALPGIAELWPILVIVLLLFGAKKLPELARAAGTSITQFKRGLKDTNEAAKLDGPDGDGDPEAETRTKAEARTKQGEPAQGGESR